MEVLAVKVVIDDPDAAPTCQIESSSGPKSSWMQAKCKLEIQFEPKSSWRRLVRAGTS